MMLPASYHTGFAPRDGYPMYPQLWRDCLLAYAPCLGPTGALLRDWAGRQNIGTLTNMVTNDDWVASGGRYALDFDGSNDEVRAASALPSMSGNIFVSCWVNVPSTTSFDAAFVTTRNVLTGASRNGFALYYRDSNNNNVTFEVVEAGTRTSAIHAVSLNTNQWYFIYGYRRLSTGQVACGVAGLGETVAASTTTGTITHEVTPTIGGFRDFNHVAARIDDIRVYSGLVSGSSLALLSSRRGIAYEMYRPAYYLPQITSARRRKILTGQV